MNKLFFVLLVPTLFFLERLYIRIASRVGIMDKPNDRSLHEKPTLRGGGIIFPVAIVLYDLFFGRDLFVVAILLVAIVGFLDDWKSQSRSVRFGVQAIAMGLAFYDLQAFAHPLWVVAILLIVAIGTVNAYNFMDGINGITGGYSLVVLGCLLYVDVYVIHFADPDLLRVMIVALLVFSFFNFRNKAICFAGDVGSLSIGFAVIYLILKLIFVSHDYVFILFLAVYGVDSVLTIVHRLVLRQNIFKAHRLHLYQVVVAKTGAPHLLLSALYMAAQLAVNYFLVSNFDLSLPWQYLWGAVILLSLGLVYLLAKRFYLNTPPHVV